MATTNSAKVLRNFIPFLIEYEGGRIDRVYGNETTPPGTDVETGVKSKDVVISRDPNVSARIHVPESAIPGKKLPLIVYYHGGGFVIESAFSPMYMRHLNHIVAKANAIAVSVEYRLAPEHPLPIAYEDAWLALKWIVSQDSEQWIKDYADFDRVYLGGDSAGGNIAHHMAIKVGLEKPDGISLRGMFLNCPYFWGKSRIGNEAEHKRTFDWNVDELWKYSCPGSLDCDNPWINPGMDPKVSSLGCKKVLVYVAETDILRDRGWYYKEVLEKSEWNGEVEVVDVEGEIHVFSVLHPTTENGIAMLNKVAEFVNQ